MNLLKSIFISNYMMLVMAIAGYAGWMLYQDGNPIAWSGVMLTAGPLLIVITRLMLFKNVARTSAHFPFINFLAGWFGFLLYAYWFSTYGGRQPSAKLKIGSTLPGFTVRNADGASVTSAQLTDKPAILIFFRGNWCPLCMAQIKELASRYKDISALGVRVVLISPQPHSNTDALAKKFGVEFDFITDEGNAAARALGIAQAHGLPMGMQMMGYDSETVLPTVIITGKDGKVIWTHETDNYRIRPEPDVYLEVLRRHRVVPEAA